MEHMSIDIWYDIANIIFDNIDINNVNVEVNVIDNLKFKRDNIRVNSNSNIYLNQKWIILII